MASSKTPVVFEFVCDAFDAETFEVIAFSGSEEISRPYRYQIDLLADNPDIDMEKLLYSQGTLIVEKGGNERKTHGVVAECRLSEALPEQRFRYHVVLVPRIWLLSLSRQNQIYQNLSITDIVAQEIVASTAKGATKDASAGLTGGDFDLRLTRTYPIREYTVQFNESDFDFISRLMEHEGLFYFFEQGAEREKMVISDNNIHFATLEDPDRLAYRPKSGLSRSEDESVLSFECTIRRVPRKLVLKEYNYRTPHLALQGEARIDEKAHGVVCEYGDHFKSPEEGDELARIHAQALYCTKQTFKGSSDSVRLSPGWRFNLEEYFREAFNSGYVITRVDHQGSQPLQGASGLNSDTSGVASYDNQFLCIPEQVPYRAPRRTGKPVIAGLINAHVDAAMLDERAEIDSHGRYKLVMPFDLSGAEAGKASRYVRKAQPYGGEDMGMHFPLLKGTEVICDFINGDPDRPIIVGVVPNPEKKSMVTAENYTRNVIKTPSGVLFEINDGKPRKNK